MHDEQLLADIAPEILNGNAALWLGPAWQIPDANVVTRMAALSWLAIWSESKGSEFASLLTKIWSRNDRLKKRVVVEVVGRIADALGSYFALSEVCPFFYLRGRENSWDAMAEREKRRARDEQVDAITKLRSGTLIFVGLSTASEIVSIVADEIPVGETAVRFVVLGLPAAEQEVLSKQLSTLKPLERRALSVFHGDIANFFAAIDHLFVTSPPRARRIRIGKSEVDLSPVLDREHPIDQDFQVLTTDLLRAPDGESQAALVEDLVSGRTPPWRAFANDVQWKRDVRFSSSVLTVLRDALKVGPPVVTCVNLAAESGSGLTTFLMEIAFRLAQSGYPTLLAKPELRRIDYELLRTFLEHLSAGQSEIPAVLVFDDSERGLDAPSGIQEIVLRLAKDGKHALIFRGATIRVGEELSRELQQSKAILSGRETERLREHWISDALRASLSEAEQASLVEWAVKYWDVPRSSFQNAIATWGKDWASDSEPPPLLVCLYFLLRDQLNSVSNLGQHLLARLETLLTDSKPSGATGERAPSNVLTPAALAEAVASLQRHFRSGDGKNRPDPGLPCKETATLCVALAALGVLRIPAPRQVLSFISGLTLAHLNAALIELDRVDLIRTSINFEGQNGLLARPAYYTHVEVVGLRHPAFGRLILQSLHHSAGSAQTTLISCDLLDELFKNMGEKTLSAYPIQLLSPLLDRIKLSQSTLTFTEDICVRFLRLQRVRGSHFHQWQWSEPETVLNVVASIPEAVARQSSVILHTRAITRYKSCRPSLNLDECRKRYELASQDLRLALDRAREMPGGERAAHVVTSHGLLYQGWARQERERGDAKKAAELRLSARQYFREGLRLGGERENPYAAFGLAGLLIEECEQEYVTDSREFAASLSEALDLLQLEPDEIAFEVDWIELRQRALALLDGISAMLVIDNLIRNEDELGIALQALRILRGVVPVEPGSHDRDQLERAWLLLTDADIKITKPSQLATLLRYAVFSCRPERSENPAYEDRFRLIEKLEGSRYVDRPIWLFDYAMLAIQTGRIKVGLDAFRKLRRGGKFLEVPLERSRSLADPNKPNEVRTARFLVMRIDDDDKGWARVIDPEGFTETVPFFPRHFRAVGSPTIAGATVTGRLRIRPAGPCAEPMRAGVS